MAAYIPIVLAIAAFLLIRMLLRLPPERSAAAIVSAVPLVVIGAGVVLTMLGRGMIGVPLTILGLSWRRRRGTAAQPAAAHRSGTSTVRTGYLEMELDHDSGEMDGRIIAGERTGVRLSTLAEHELLELYRKFSAVDVDSATVLGTYLDRYFPGWRQRIGGDREAGGGNEMTREEALQILGLAPGASREEIHQAWRRLMKKVHPDSGGSAALAAKINAAKDTLLK